MGKLILLPWPETIWSAPERMATRTPLPLSKSGRIQIVAWARLLSDQEISVVYTSKEETSKEMAEVLVEYCGADSKTAKNLQEVDAGLWDGLTAQQLKQRYPKVFRRWFDDPAGVTPPEGEEITAAFERLRESVEPVIRKLGDRTVAIVLGPLAFGLIRCFLQGLEPTEVHAMMANVPVLYHQNEDGFSDTGNGFSEKADAAAPSTPVSPPQKPDVGD